MYRKQLKEASQQEIFQAVSYVVKDVVIDDWLATQQAFDDQDPKIVLISPLGKHLRYVLRLHFPASNNVAEYEALVNRL